MTALKIEKPALVSPSMSGRFSIPLIVSDPNAISAYIPVAPVIPPDFKPSFIPSGAFRTLVVWGSKDEYGKDRSKELLEIPGAVPFEIEGGSHPCYLDEPELFNSKLVNFLASR